MEYRDLSPYSYSRSLLPMANIGWLGLEHGIQEAPGPPPGTDWNTVLRAASPRVSNQMMGHHRCEFCAWQEAPGGTGEYRYFCRNGTTYVAPQLVLHYAEEHAYQPPGAFLEAIGMRGELLWDPRAERLAAALEDADEDLDLRWNAIYDIANWRDARSVSALHAAAKDSLLLDCAGFEIGESLGIILGREALDGLIENAEVRRGIEASKGS
jgi:hypothetical protein